MTLPLSGSVNATGSQMVGRARGDVSDELKKEHEFGELVSSLSQSKGAPLECPPVNQKCPSALMAGFDLSILLACRDIPDPAASVSDKEDDAADSEKSISEAAETSFTLNEIAPWQNLNMDTLPASVSFESVVVTNISDECSSSIPTEGWLNRSSPAVEQTGIEIEGVEREFESSFTGSNVILSNEARDERFGERSSWAATIRQSLVDVPSRISAEKSGTEFQGVSPTPASGTKDVKVTANAPTMKIHVSEIASHFPVIVMESLFTPEFRVIPEAVALNAEETPPAVETPLLVRPEPERMRIIQFELEPADLGTLQVKMRVFDSRVEIAIESETVVTTDRLSKARDALSVLIEQNGLKLHAYEVATQAEAFHSKPSSGGDIASSWENTEGRRENDRGEFFGQERSRQERQPPQRFKARKSQSYISDDVSVGILL